MAIDHGLRLGTEVPSVTVSAHIPMNYRSTSDLAQTVRSMTARLLDKYEIVVGVPRSGILPAVLIALNLDLPLTDLASFVDGRRFGGGARLASARRQGTRALIVDDTIDSGTELLKTSAALQAAGLRDHCDFAVVYSSESGVKTVDHYGEIVPGPRCFEWNVFHHGAYVPSGCFDLDGVLCRDPTESECADPMLYKSFLQTAQLLRRPSLEIGWIVTSRLEQHRRLTEAWLHANGIKYRSLLMMKHSTVQERRAAQDVSRFKALAYRRTGASLFVESSAKQAAEIAAYARRPVLCADTMEMVYPGDAPPGTRLRVAYRAPLVRRLTGAMPDPLKAGLRGVAARVWRV